MPPLRYCTIFLVGFSLGALVVYLANDNLATRFKVQTLVSSVSTEASLYKPECSKPVLKTFDPSNKSSNEHFSLNLRSRTQCPDSTSQ
jgi:uncharacterized membrane-anchored protein YhcB (DUF1043 family)